MLEEAVESRVEEFRVFLERRHGLSENTVDNHCYALQKFLKETGNAFPEESEVLEFKRQMVNEGFANSHINNVLKGMEYYLEMEGKEVSFKKLNRKEKIPDIPSREDVKKLLYACRTYRDFAIVKLLVTTGLRNSELRNLKLKDVEMEERKAVVRDGKGGKDRVVFFPERTKEAIESYLERRQDGKSPCLFLSTKTGKKLTRSALLHLVKRVGRRAGLDNPPCPHELRHFFGTQQISAGQDASVLKELMGHEDVSTTMMYVHLNEDELKSQYDRVSDDFGF